MENYDPKRKEKYIRTIKNDKRKDNFLRSFQGQSEVSYTIIKLFLEDDDNWKEISDAEYIFNQFFYQMS